MRNIEVFIEVYCRRKQVNVNTPLAGFDGEVTLHLIKDYSFEFVILFYLIIVFNSSFLPYYCTAL